MREDDAVDLVENTPLEGLGKLSADVVYRHIDFLGRELPGPIDLYQRWERQQWSASALDFSVDRRQWLNLPAEVHQQLGLSFRSFYFGEQAVTNTLAPLVIGAPTDDDRLFLATQLVDEARHAFFFSRFFHDVLGETGATPAPPTNAQPTDGPSAYDRIFDPGEGELFTVTEAVRVSPGDYGTWVQSVALYHLMVEALLALTGQRVLLRIMRNGDLLPGFLAGFTAVTRDESRHVSYGVWALRRAVREGHQGEIEAVVDRTLQPCMRIYSNPSARLVHPSQLPPGNRVDPRDNWGFAVESITKRLRAAGVDEAYLADVDRRAFAHVWESVGLYEQIHGEEHPVRAWERGEVQAAVAVS
jgi:ribonucleoside-diphosphate reductase beta chain